MSRTVELKLSDLDTSNYAPKPGTTPNISGDPVDLRSLQFTKVPVTQEKYGPIYEQAYKQAAELCLLDESRSMTVEAMRISSELIAEYERQVASQQTLAAAPIVPPITAIREELFELNAGEKLSAEDLLLDLDEMLKPGPAMPPVRFQPEPRRAEAEVKPSPAVYTPEAVVWPDSSVVAGPSSVSVSTSDWLGLTGLGPEPKTPAFAVRYDSDGRRTTMLAHWIYKNDLMGSDQPESIVAVYDKRWDGYSHAMSLMSVKRGGASRLFIADMLDGRIDDSNIDSFDVADVVWGMEIGDLGLVVFFLTDSNS